MLINFLVSELLALTAVFVMSWFFWNKFRAKRIFVIEDSQSDQLLFKINMNLRNCAVNYYSSVDGIIKDIALKRPDAVIIDYLLAGKTKGDVLLKFCDDNGINAILVTGYEGDILGVDKDRILRKSSGREYYDALEDWTKKVTS